MNTERIHPLLISLKNLIQSAVEERISSSAIRNKFEELSGEYNSIVKDREEAQSLSILRSLLYHHNVNNFSKATAIYSSDGATVTEIKSCGEISLLSLLPEIILQETSIVESLPRKIHLKEINDLNFNLYIFPFSTGDETVYIATVTSSYYFSIKSFHYISSMIKSLFIRDKVYRQPLVLRYNDDIYHGIFEYIMSVSHDSPVKIYACKLELTTTSSLHEINNMMKISEHIYTLFNNEFDEHATILRLSQSLYIVLTRDILSRSHLGDSQTLFIEDHAIGYNVVSDVVKNTKEIMTFLKKIYSLDNKNKCDSKK